VVFCVLVWVVLLLGFFLRKNFPFGFVCFVVCVSLFFFVFEFSLFVRNNVIFVCFGVFSDPIIVRDFRC